MQIYDKENIMNDKILKYIISNYCKNALQVLGNKFDWGADKGEKRFSLWGCFSSADKQRKEIS